MHTTNYFNTFIGVAEDCPVSKAEIPPQKGENKTVATMQFEMIAHNPYRYTSDEVIFHIHATRNNLQKNDLEKESFFSKGQACLRSSPLPKRYGWGIHSDAQGKVAMYPMESEEYRKLTADKSLKITKAMRSKRK